MAAETDRALPPPPAAFPTNACLLLDFDGTLVEIAPTPDAVEVTPRVHAALDAASAKLDGRVAIVSGRSIADIDARIGVHGLAASGSHGIEVRGFDGMVAPVERPTGLDRLHAAFAAYAADRPGLLVEDKPLGVALHYRAVPHEEDAARAYVAGLMHADEGLVTQHGHMVVEVRMAGGDKGTGIAALIRSAGSEGLVPIFVGDDLTDEPGFAAAARLGGYGVLVGPARATAASYRLGSVADVLGWIEGASA